MYRPAAIIAAAVLGLAGSPAIAQDSDPRAAEQASARQAESGKPPERIRSVTLTGTDKCPESTGDEIVVCSRLDANEQFRVPKQLRNPTRDLPAASQSWVNRAATVDQVGRVAGGLPNTCSPVGTGGQTGCGLAYGRAWQAEKRQDKRDAESVPGSDESAEESEPRS